MVFLLLLSWQQVKLKARTTLLYVNEQTIARIFASKLSHVRSKLAGTLFTNKMLAGKLICENILGSLTCKLVH